MSEYALQLQYISGMMKMSKIKVIMPKQLPYIGKRKIQQMKAGRTRI